MKRKISMPLFAGFLIVALTFLTAPASATVPNPTVIGPIPVNVAPGDPSHDYTFFTPTIDLAAYGYIEEEFFIQGSANRYNTPTGQTGSIISSGHPYKTRIVVRRPISSKDFNGIVLLEWQNVTAGYDLDAHWGASWEHFIRSGYAWVGVSAQRVGVHGFPPGTPGQVTQGLKAWSPIRYGTLDVTVGGTILDDSLCYDIFSQATQAMRNPTGIDPMNGFNVKMVLAIGASQSASRLVIYHNSIEPLHGVVDAYYLLVGGYGTRTDLSVKVFQLLSETDVISGAYRRRPNSEYFRTWEIAGAAHSGYFSAIYRQPIIARDSIVAAPLECTYPPYSRIPTHYVLNAAYDHLVRWVDDGTPPPTAPLIELVSVGGPGLPAIVVRDSLGLALGGIRLPDLAVPTALNNGTNSGSGFCRLYGTYIPFDNATLHGLYRNHGAYVSAVTQATTDNLKDGYIVTEDAQEIRVTAAQSDTPPK